MFRKILVPLDGSALAEQALPVAAALARASGASIDLVRAHQPLPALVALRARGASERWKNDDAYLESIGSELMTSPAIVVTHAAPEGDAADVIAERALNVMADLIVMTSHGRGGFSRFWLGSVADAVVRAAGVPVLLVRPSAQAPGHGESLPLFKRILVPLDGSARSASVLTGVASLARCADARIALLRVVIPVPLPNVEGNGGAPAIDRNATDVLETQAREDLDIAARQLAAAGVERVETRVVVDPHPAAAILRCAIDRSAQLIAMSTHGRGAARALVGSVADKVMRASGLPMLLHRPVSVTPSNALLAEADVSAQLPALSGA